MKHIWRKLWRWLLLMSRIMLPIQSQNGECQHAVVPRDTRTGTSNFAASLQHPQKRVNSVKFMVELIHSWSNNDCASCRFCISLKGTIWNHSKIKVADVQIELYSDSVNYDANNVLTCLASLLPQYLVTWNLKLLTWHRLWLAHGWRTPISGVWTGKLNNSQVSVDIFRPARLRNALSLNCVGSRELDELQASQTWVNLPLSGSLDTEAAVRSQSSATQTKALRARRRDAGHVGRRAASLNYTWTSS